MRYRILGKTGFRISEISLGTWQVGGGWREYFDEGIASRILHRAMDLGVNFIDTADIYGGGMSEKAVGKAVRERKDRIFVATKIGKRLPKQVPGKYNRKNLFLFVEDSLRNTGLETLDLLQLHTPPIEIYRKAKIFAVLDDLKREGKILHYGVSVKTVPEALAAMEHPGVAPLQLIFNMFRQRPAEDVFPIALQKNVGIIARVPLASGMLTGKLHHESTFSSEDHRNFNRDGKVFDQGETFSGVDYAVGLQAVEELKALFPHGDLAHYALRWILRHSAVSCAIPGASRPEQAESNALASAQPPLSHEQIWAVERIYDKYIRSQVHARW